MADSKTELAERLLALPPELLCAVFSFLPTPDLVTAFTCRFVTGSNGEWATSLLPRSSTTVPSHRSMQYAWPPSSMCAIPGGQALPLPEDADVTTTSAPSTVTKVRKRRKADRA